jgi:hypothetical protein
MTTIQLPHHPNNTTHHSERRSPWVKVRNSRNKDAYLERYAKPDKGPMPLNVS